MNRLSINCQTASMSMGTISVILLWLMLCSCSSTPGRPHSQAELNQWSTRYSDYYKTYHITPPLYFWKGSAASNGLTVILAIRSPSPESRTKVQALIGSTVAFVGDSYGAREGIFSDLETHRESDSQPHDNTIEVDMIPFTDVHPTECGMWTAEVLGTLRSVDFQKRVIRIKARPEKWKVRSTL